VNRGRINLLIDALLFLALSAMLGIGLLIRYVLVPGYRRWEIYGRNVDLSFCGLDRHDWGAIHYLVGLLLAGLLVLHVALHWGAIVAVSRKLIPNRLLRRLVAIGLAVVALSAMAFSLFVEPDVLERPRGAGRRHHQAPVGRGHGR